MAFSGEVFGIETKDIKSKKTGKSFHLVVFDVTDYTDSITCQMFINADEKGDAAFEEVNARLKKGKNVIVRGKAQYNDYAREVVVMANGICETDPAAGSYGRGGGKACRAAFAYTNVGDGRCFVGKRPYKPRHFVGT